MGDYGTDEALDWLQIAEHILQSYGVPPHARVDVAVSRFRDAAAAWCRSLCTQREQLGEPQVTSWSDFRIELKGQFLP